MASNYDMDKELFSGGNDLAGEREASKAAKQKRQDTAERNRVKRNALQTSRRTSTGRPVEQRANSVFQPPPEEGPGGQQRLFSPGDEPEAFETKASKRARTERVPAPRREWDDVRKDQSTPNPLTGKRQGVSKESVEATLREAGVDPAGARRRLQQHWESANKRASGEKPVGQTFYSDDQPDRIESDAKTFNLPFHVALAANAVMSPKTALATSRGFQTNREAAFKVMQHVVAGKPGTPDTGGRGLRANADKAADIIRQHLSSGTHPLDATDETGHHLLSGPKVEEYYASHIDPSRSPTDIQHSRILFGPKVRSEMTPEESAHKEALIEEFGKDSKEVGAYIPKSPAEKLLEHPGVHEWAAHVTGLAAKKAGVQRSEFQSAVWHEHKTQRGGPSSVQTEMQPLFASRKKPSSQGRQGRLPLKSRPQARNISGSQFGSL